MGKVCSKITERRGGAPLLDNDVAMSCDPTPAKGPIKVGAKLPDVDDTFIGGPAPEHKVKIADLFKGKRGILTAVPGAFTPVWSAVHVPAYITEAETLNSEGCEIIVCVTVNDPFVVAEWAKSLNAEGKVIMVSDPRATFTKAMGLDLEVTALLGNVRSQRYAVVVNDGVVEAVEIDENPMEVKKTLPSNVVKKLSPQNTTEK